MLRLDSKEILKFCIENGLLVDKEVLALLSEEGDFDSVKMVIEKIKNQTHKRVITKDLFLHNKEQVIQVLSNLPEKNQKKLENLKIKLGLSIEISKEVSIPLKNELSFEADSLGDVKILSMNLSQGKKFTLDNFVKHFRGRFLEMRGFVQEKSGLDNLVSINKLSNVRQNVSLIGMVYDKKITKNGNLILDIEDLTGRVKVLVNQNKEELYKKSEDIVLDSVLGFKCSGNRDILFVQDILFPDSFVLNRKKSNVDECAIFISDLHIGSKNFMEENFLKFIDYLNGNTLSFEDAKKIKYLFIVGDLVTGIGNYPDQERDLKKFSLEDQYVYAAELLGKIRKNVKIIVSPGNHDGVRLMEPQPLYDEKYAWALYDMENVILTENPAMVNIGARKDFSGLNVLTYHGFSYPYYASRVSKLINAKAMNSPEKIMEFLLKQRHLAPTHGSVQYFPSEKDTHFIRGIPDIFVSGHTHKSAVTYYNNILIVSGSSWETMTPYQEKFGNLPDHCKVPMVNLKTREVKILDFE